MTKRWGDFTLDEIKERCEEIKHDCYKCIFHDICQISICTVNVDLEIELPEPKRCGDCDKYNSGYCTDGGPVQLWFEKSKKACKKFEPKQENICRECKYENSCSVHNDSDADTDEDYAELKNITKCSRFTPKKTYRPFKDTDELIAEFKRRFNANCPDYAMPLIWVECNDLTTKSLVIEFLRYKKSVLFNNADKPISLEDLFEEYWFLDNSPCGMEVSE